MIRSRLVAALCSAVLLAAPLAGCASGDKDVADASELKSKKKKKKDDTPKNYSLFKKRELNQEILRRGQKAQSAPALDSY